ncbi:hypothetical protein ACGFX4_34920 [Kitasatospora sp. NPDC048365]|uniref:hypothetical protein n=1 Tax=Kitasatospora sp. NPDC048365 TaxID=3364050 RepID=UPI00371F8E9D
MGARFRRAWPWLLVVGVVLALVAGVVLAGLRWLNGPTRGYAVGTWRSEAGTVVQLAADGTVRAEGLPADENCWLPSGERVRFSASGTWEPGLIDSVGPGVVLTLKADGKLLPCYVSLAYAGKPWLEGLVFNDGLDLNPLAKD